MPRRIQNWRTQVETNSSVPDRSFWNQSWYSSTSISLLVFSISIWQTSIFSEPLTQWFDQNKSWIWFLYLSSSNAGIQSQFDGILGTLWNHEKIIETGRESSVVEFGSPHVGECKNIILQKLTESNMYLIIIFLFNNESKFVLWANDSFVSTLSLPYGPYGMVLVFYNCCLIPFRSVRWKRKSVLFYFNWIALRVLIFYVRFGFQETGNFLGIETVVILWTSGRILIGQWNIILTCTNV